MRNAPALRTRPKQTAALNDHWYVRLPDGQVIRAKSTKAVRHHIRHGRIPKNALVRRSTFEDWATLDWSPEFADLTKAHSSVDVPATNHKKTAKALGQEFRVLGVRGLVEELLKALESTLHRGKLAIAATAGLVIGLGWAVYQTVFPALEQSWQWYGLGALSVLLLVVACLANAVIGQMTFVELSRLRPARANEVRTGLFGKTLNLMMTLLLFGGIWAGLLIVVRTVPQWLAPAEGPVLAEPLLVPLLAGRLVLEVFLWPVLALTFLFAPILIVEECGFLSAFRDWWRLLRTHLRRILLYEALALALGLLLCAPFLVPVALTASFNGLESGPFAWVNQATLSVLAGLSLTPLLAYVFVANVYIYINLRYEFFQSATAKNKP
ncbi:MAG: hypothetical protein L0Y72_05470 [Gemmataceae bacterium]|nr:hypothetical protein [Gemmataceae bacterium]MCI0738473.1 hypothetical protein [Gemmataceae bacterium]